MSGAGQMKITPIKKKMKFVIPVDMLDADVTVAIDFSEKDLTKFLKRPQSLAAIKGWDSDPACAWTIFPDNAGLLLLLRSKSNAADFFDTVAHEVSHAAHRLLSALGAPLNEQTAEIYAHLQGFLMGQIVKKIWGQR